MFPRITILSTFLLFSVVFHTIGQSKLQTGRALISELKYTEGIQILEDALKEVKDDSLRIEVLLEIANASRRSFKLDILDRSIARFDLNKATQEQKFKIYNLMSLNYYHQNNIDKAIEALQTSIKTGKELGLNTGTPYNNLSYLYREKSDSYNQLKCIQAAYDEFVKTKDSTEIIYAIYALGDYYVVENQLDKAEKYIQECLAFQKRTSNSQIKYFTGFNNAYSEIQYEKKKYKEAIFYSYESLKLSRIVNDPEGAVHAYQSLSKCHMKLGNYKEALKFGKMLLSGSIDLNYNVGIIYGYQSIGEANMALKNSKEGIKALNLALEKAQLMPLYESIAKCSQILKEYYKKQGVLGKALDYTEILRVANDSITSSINRKKSVTLLAQFESEIKDKKIVLQELSIAKEKVKISKMQMVILSMLIGLLLLLGIAIYIRYKNKLKIVMLLQRMSQNLTEFQNLIIAYFNKSSTELSLSSDIQWDFFLQQNKIIEARENYLSPDEQTLFDGIKKKIDTISSDLQNKITRVKTFSYSISHDLKSPILNLIELTQQLKLDNTVVEEIKSSAKHAYELVEAYTALGQIEEHELDFKEIDLKSLIESEVKKIKNSIDFPSKCIIEIGTMNKVCSDALLLRQLINNLLSNAVKYSSLKENPIVKISIVNNQADKLTLMINDNGIGFPKEEAKKIFSPFVRHTEAYKFTGTGIGLALCKQITEKLGSEIWAESENLDGATFFVTLKKVNVL